MSEWDASTYGERIASFARSTPRSSDCRRHTWFSGSTAPGSFRGRFMLLGELDLMARAAGLTLRERWGGWKQEPLSAASRRQVSVYERA